jgi:general secretion pathway protein N
VTIKTRYLALFAAVYAIVALIVTAPAYLLDSAVKHFSHQRLSLANCRGTIWQGSATPVLNTANHASVALHTLQWHLNPHALLQGRLSVTLAWDNLEGQTPMQLLLDSQSVVLNNLQLPLSAEVISELSPYLKPAQFSGSLMLESPQLRYSEESLQGRATAHWRGAGSAMSTVYPLGDYQIEMIAAKDKISATLSTQNGPLLLAGQGGWSHTQGFHFYGTARATNQTALNELLHHLGPESTPGVYQISI